MRQETRQTPWGREDYVLMDVSEAVSLFDRYRAQFNNRNARWLGDTHAEFRHKVVTGDNSMVEASERMLASVEDLVPVTRGWRVRNDVVGGVPNVPAYLAGHPMHMRRRERVARESAPLSIYLDLTSTATIHAKDVMARGVVMLALVRMLVEHRPVELWAGVTQDVGRGAGTVAWRIDTAPMDLARAAYHVASSAMPRLFGYGINRVVNGAGGFWAFGTDTFLQKTTGEERFRALFGNETLFVPPLLYTDAMVREPAEWLRRTMKQYVQIEEEA